MSGLESTKTPSARRRDGPAAEVGDDGNVVVVNPTWDSRFDMGNMRLFATFDGEGSLTRCMICDGFDAPTWRMHVRVDGVPLSFGRAVGIGRLWELDGEASSTRVTLLSFLDEGSAAAHQRISIRNDSARPVSALIRLEFSAGYKRSFFEELRNRYARWAARLPGTAGWWAVSGAKISLPFAAKRLAATENGGVRTKGKYVFSWSADSVCEGAPGSLYREFPVHLESGTSAELNWAMCMGSEQEAFRRAGNAGPAMESAREYASWLGACYGGEDVLQKSVFIAGLNAAVSMFKEFPLGFAGLVAGPDYAYPPRLYFRDGYWTAQILLRFRPDLVKRHLLSLARGVHADGQCPSGVFAPHLLSGHAGADVESLDWLPDHYDSPSFFVLLVEEYVAATRDPSFLDETVSTWEGKDAKGHFATVWALARKAADYLIKKDSDGDGLIEKPYAANDWADNVRRSVWVAYDQVLYAAALLAAEKLARARGEAAAAERYRTHADLARSALNETLWDDELGHFVDYRRPGFAERHFHIDSLIALRYRLVDSDKIDRLLAAAKRMQTRENTNQPYGDWGVMCAYPYYGQAGDLFSKSALPLCYHNGADWPYWDGVYALILRERGDPDWRYAAMRWWEYSLSRGWLTPVEYYSPPYEPGGMLQGWSSMPALACAEKQRS